MTIAMIVPQRRIISTAVSAAFTCSTSSESPRRRSGPSYFGCSCSANASPPPHILGVSDSSGSRPTTCRSLLRIRRVLLAMELLIEAVPVRVGGAERARVHHELAVQFTERFHHGSLWVRAAEALLIFDDGARHWRQISVVNLGLIGRVDGIAEHCCEAVALHLAQVIVPDHVSDFVRVNCRRVVRRSRGEDVTRVVVWQRPAFGPQLVPRLFVEMSPGNSHDAWSGSPVHINYAADR